MDDKTLIHKIGEGDRSAIGILVENNKKLVWHIIISMIGNNSDCEDIFQEVFLQVFKGISRFRADSRISSWIGSITHHICVDYLRKKKKEMIFRNHDNDQDSIPKPPMNMGWNQLDTKDLNQVVLGTISKLPAEYRTVITLYHLDECSYEEIAEITGMPGGTVKSYLHRGRNLLREKLVSIIPDLMELLHDV